MIDTKALREKVLDLAIRGKLVEQDPNDEPASVLLERIRAEKQQMVKEGKLKAKDIKNDTIIYKGDDNLHYEKFHDGTVKCIEGEIPFDVPEGWSFERLGNITNIARGGSPRPIEKYLTDNKNGLNWIKIGDTSKDGKYISSTKEKISPDGLNKTRFVSKGDFLLTNSMSFGRPYILKIDGCIHDGWLVIGNIETVFNADYLYYALSSNFMYQTLSLIAAGSTVKNLKSDSVKSVLFPIPPMSEQKRISKKLEIIINFIDNINSEKNVLIDTIQRIKSKILDLAIRGKLVPQDPNDEHASVLLERIRTEKEELIKQGKIKRDKKESVIFKGDDNSYYIRSSDNKSYDVPMLFNLPNGWEWTTFPTISHIELGKTLDKAKNTGVFHPYIRSVNVQWGYVDLSDLKKMRFESKEIDRYTIKKDDLLICEGGDVGRCCIWDRTDSILYQNAIHRVRFYDSINCRFYMYLMMFFESKGILKRISNGVTIKHLTNTVLSSIIIPLPPIAEQKRIVGAIETLFEKLDQIVNSIS